MNRKLRQQDPHSKLKEKQIKFLLEDVEENLEKYKKSHRIKGQTAL